MPIQPAPDLVVAGRFRLSRLIGRGGMGSVWLATHLGLDVPCAVKFIEGEGADIPEVQARFEREAKAAAQLRSPHVVQILDHGVWEGTPYIAMELLDGEDLGKRLMRVGRLAPHEILAVVTQVCRALSRAHALGIVHRDLKPDNIFLVRDDDREIAKVLDFGIAKSSAVSAPGAGTRTGAMLGTPYYMSPEQAQGVKAVDARSDLWSLAVIVFEALTGRRPFESEALGDLLMKIIVAPVPVPSQFARDLPATLDAWWTKASQRDPSQRFQSAKELCDSLAMAFGRSAGDAHEASSLPAQFAGNAPARTAPAYGPPPVLSAGASTAAPIAHTYGDKPAGVGRRTGLVVAVGAGVLVLGAAALGVSLAVKGSGDKAAGGSLGAGPPGAAAGADAMAVERLAATATSPPTAAPSTAPAPAAATSAATSVAATAVAPEAPASPTPSAPPTLAQPSGAPPASPKSTHGAAASWGGGSPAASPTVRPAPPPPKPPPADSNNKKKAVDLGI